MRAGGGPSPPPISDQYSESLIQTAPSQLKEPVVSGAGVSTFCTTGAVGNGVLKGPIGQRSLPTRLVLAGGGLGATVAACSTAGFSGATTLATLLVSPVFR